MPKPKSTPAVTPAEAAGARYNAVAALLDQALAKVAKRLKTGEVSSAMLKQIVELAKAAGVPIVDSAVNSYSPGVDRVLESLADVDFDALNSDTDYAN